MAIKHRRGPSIMMIYSAERLYAIIKFASDEEVVQLSETIRA